MALTNAERQRNYRERLKAKRPKKVVPDFVDHPIFGRTMTLAGAMKDCADNPRLRAEFMAQAAADERRLEAEAEGEGDEDEDSASDS